MTFTPITPVLVVRNISKYDVNILGRVKLRPGEQKDLYAELEYNEFGSLTSTVLKELESPSGEIYRLWKVLNAIRIVEFVNPTHVGAGVSADSFSTSNDYFEGAVLGFESGELKWLAGGGGGSITAVTASSPLSSSGGATPDISLGTVGVAKGGTGQTSLTSNAVVLGNGALAVQTVAPGTSGNVLTSDGTTWSSAPPLATEYDQQIFVSDGADPLVATGAPQRPFASISAAMAAITDAAPSKRYAISVAAGEYTEATTTIAVGSNGQALPQGTINVASTTGFLSAGLLSVTTSGGVQTVTYTGKTATSFTGCTGGTGTMSTGGAVGAILALKPNVFIVGASRDAVRITASAFVLDASFTGGADNRSGFSNVSTIGAHNYNFTTVTSTTGKVYFRDVIFTWLSSTAQAAVTLTGYNNAIVQAQFSGCQIAGVFTVQGVNIGVFNDNICTNNIVLTQSPFGGVPTILVATGGACSGTVTATTTVNDFDRRISIFARSFWMNGAVTVDGPSSYLDHTVDSLPSGGASTPNGGNLVSIDYGANKALSNLVYPTAVNNPIMPATTSATNFGDWGKQWLWNFGYLHASTGTDCYLISYPSAFGAETGTGKNVYLLADGAGLAANISGGGVGLYSSNATGTGNSGSIEAETGTAVNGNSGSITLTTGRGRAGAIAAGSNGQTLPSAVINVASVNGFPSTGTILVATSTGTQTVTYTGTTSASTTVAVGSNGQALPQGTINVASTASFLASGTLRVTTSGGVQTVTYTGKTATSFTGCAGGTGTMSTGGAVAQDAFTGCAGGTGTMSTGGDVEFSGLGVRGVISLNGRQVDVNSTKIVNLTDGTNPGDAANVGQLNTVSLNTSANAVVAGEAVCADSTAARTVKKADVSALATARVIGIAVGAGKVQTAGIALAKFTSAPSIGDAAYLSATTGELTGTAPGSGIEAEIGIVVDNVAVDGKYAVALQIKKPV